MTLGLSVEQNSEAWLPQVWVEYTETNVLWQQRLSTLRTSFEEALCSLPPGFLASKERRKLKHRLALHRQAWPTEACRLRKSSGFSG